MPVKHALHEAEGSRYILYSSRGRRHGTRFWLDIHTAFTCTVPLSTLIIIWYDHRTLRLELLRVAPLSYSCASHRRQHRAPLTTDNPMLITYLKGFQRI